MSDDPVADRIHERVEGIKNGDPSEQVHDPEHDQQRADRARRAEAKRERDRAQQEAVRAEALSRVHGGKKHDPRDKSRAADPEGSKQVSTATKSKSTAKKSTATKKSTTAKKQPAKATAAPKSNGSSNGAELDLSGRLPFTLTWTEPAGGAEHVRTYWRGARLDIKAFLEDEGKLSDDEISDGLKKAAEALRKGKGSKVGSVTITLSK